VCVDDFFQSIKVSQQFEFELILTRQHLDA